MTIFSRSALLSLTCQVPPSTKAIVHVDMEKPYELALPPGILKGRDLLDLFPRNAVIELPDAVICASAVAGRARRVAYGENATDSGANPDFTPHRMTDMERRVRDMVSAVSAENKGLAARLAAYEKANKAAKQAKPAKPEKPVKVDPVESVDQPEGEPDAPAAKVAQ